MSYLTEICERKRSEVRRLSDVTDLVALQREIEPCTMDVPGALRRGDRLQIIAEHKRRSPSRGPIRADSNPAEIGAAYAGAGAAAISVLTDEPHFGGSADDLRAVREAVSIPVLCKDFILSPIQVLLARSWGADLVLLIVAALKRSELMALHRLACSLGMTPLVEVHDAHEIHIAQECGAKVIGVNNRNLHTFHVDVQVSETLIQHLPDDVIKVSESGIRGPDELRRVTDAGYDAVLVGERLMSAPEPGVALNELIHDLPLRE
jgi:indole-3-glycerol phosphate synthase